MIQRIQTALLFAASIMMLVLFINPLAQMELKDNLFLLFYHNRIEAMDPGEFNTLSTWPVTFLLILTITLSIFTIFQYKNRVRQIRLCVLNILLHFGLIAMIFFFSRYTMYKEEGMHSAFLWPIVIPLISVVLVYLALKRIQRDHLLIKSMDRLRR